MRAICPSWRAMLSVSTGRIRAHLWIALPLLLAAGLRFHQIDIPYIEPYNSISRQAIVAEVARNFYRHGYDFMRPEVDDNGPGNPLYNAEMPFYSYLMALMYAAVGGVREWAARSVSVVFSLLTLVLTMDLCRRLYGKAGAAAAGVLMAVSPLYLALSRALQPEACMILASVGCVYFFHRHTTATIGTRWLWLSGASVFLAVATKIYNLYLVLPLAVMALRSEGWAALRRVRYWAVLAAALLPLLWYYRMMQEGQAHQLIYDPYDFTKTRGPSGKAYWELFAPGYLLWALKILCAHLLTPVGTLLVALSVLDRRPRTDRRSGGPLPEWSLSVVLMFFIMWRTVLDHSYYLLPALTVLALLTAKGASVLWAFAQRTTTRRVLVAAVIGAALIAQSVVLMPLYKGIYEVPPDILEIVRAGQLVDQRTGADDLVVASYGGSTALLYYTGRRGWAFDVRLDQDGTLIERLEGYRNKGARYFITSRQDQLKAAEGFYAYLQGSYRVLVDDGLVLLVDLGAQSGGNGKI